jgi:hypothetical protein
LKMDLTGRFVRFWLSPGGREALSEIVSGAADFEALVVEESGLGLWLWIAGLGRQSREVTLLKWEYLAAASLDYEPEAPKERPAAGFKAPSE